MICIMYLWMKVDASRVVGGALALALVEEGVVVLSLRR